MAEVIVTSDEEIDSALKRLRHRVNLEGIVKKAKRSHFEGALTKTQRREGKKMAARRRWHRFLRNHPEKKFDKIKAEFWSDDTSWATGDETWCPDLTPTKKQKAEAENETSGYATGPASFHRFGEDRRKNEKEIEELVTAEPLLPTIHVCGIAEYKHGNVSGIVIVRSYKDEDESGKNEKIPREKFTFPGGGVELAGGETPEQAIVREYKEETGLIVAPPQETHRIFVAKINDEGNEHTFICFLLKITGGEPKMGEEICELKLMPYDKLEKFAFEVRGLSRNHALSLEACSHLKKSGNLPVLPDMPKKTRAQTARRKEDSRVSVA